MIWLLDDGRIMGGGQRLVLRLARHLAASRGADSVLVVCPDDSELATHCRDAGVRVEHVVFPDPHPLQAPRIAACVVRLRRLFARAPDGTTVVAAAVRCAVYARPALARTGLRFVQLMQERDSASRSRLARLLGRPPGVLVLGSVAAGAYRDALPAGASVRVMNNFLSHDELADLGSLRGDRAEPPVVAAVGRFIPEKGLVELVDELAASPDAWSSAEILAGSEDPEYEATVRERAAALGNRMRVHSGDVPVRDVLARAGALVVPSTGNEGAPTVILEALAAGVPVVVRRPVWSADYEGLPVVAYDGPSDLGDALRSWPRDPAPVGELARRFGPEQALDAIESDDDLALRPADERDTQRLLDWRNDPETRRWAFQPGEVDLATHEAWFARRRADPDSVIWIAEQRGEPVGQVRLDREGAEAEVSIALAPEARGRGLGRRLIDRAAREAPGALGVERLTARIKPDNVASVRAFEAAGFTESSRDDDVVTLRRRLRSAAQA
jgi:RimJ/RimL family protein N-acetyltransferase/glycosyltransferase involved in cell wall biosynthesis